MQLYHCNRPSIASLGVVTHDLQAQLSPDNSGVAFRDDSTIWQLSVQLVAYLELWTRVLEVQTSTANHRVCSSYISDMIYIHMIGR